MSDIDRRRYEYRRLHHDAWGPLSVGEPDGEGGYRTINGQDKHHYYHESAVRELVAAMQRMHRGACFCEVGIGNPMLHGEHTKACEKVRELLDHYKDLK